MNTKFLIALMLIPAGTFAAAQATYVEGEKFEAPTDVADKMIAEGFAKVDEAAAVDGAKASKTAKLTKVRLLADSVYGNANDIAELDAGQLKEAEAGGLADSTKAAVAYAATLDQNKQRL